MSRGLRVRDVECDEDGGAWAAAFQGCTPALQELTAAIEADGRVSEVLPAFAEGVLTVSVQGYNGATPYVRIGNGGVLLLAALAVIPALLRRRQTPV